MSDRDSENLERIREIMEDRFARDDYSPSYEPQPPTWGQWAAGALMLLFWAWVAYMVLFNQQPIIDAFNSLLWSLG